MTSIFEALRGAPAQFPPDLARVTSLVRRIHRTLKPGIDVDKSTPVGDANTPERSRDEVSNRVAFAARDDEVIGCRVAPDQLKRACVVAGETPVTTYFEVADGSRSDSPRAILATVRVILRVTKVSGRLGDSWLYKMAVEIDAPVPRYTRASW